MKFLTKTKKYFKKDWYLVVLICFSIVFFAVYSYLAATTPELFNSPDETANFYFAKNFALTGQVSELNALNIFSHGMIHPRSIIVYQGYLTPVSFLGISLIYGSIARFLGTEIIVYLTPFFASLAVLFFYGLIKNIFDKKTAFISALILFIHPAYWYFTSKSMMHNVLFVALLIIGLFFITQLKFTFDPPEKKLPKTKEQQNGQQQLFQKKKQGKIKNFFKYIFRKRKFVKSLIYYSLAGIFVGLALTVRTSEAFWVAMLIGIIGLFYINKIRWLHLLIGLSFMAMTFVPILYNNQVLYNDFFKFGYTLNHKQEVIAEEEQVSDTFGENTMQYLKQKLGFFPWDILFPYGIVKEYMAGSFYNYFIDMFLLFNLLLVVGLLMFILYLLNRKKKKALITYFLASIAISGFLIAFYGSWEFQDNINGDITIGTSYIRYWLPAYIATIPIIALVVSYVWRIFSKYKFHYLSLLSIVLFFIPIAYFSFDLTYISNPESLLGVRKDLWSYYQKKALISDLTEPNSLIIVDRADKILFPQRDVVSFMYNYDIFIDMNFIVRNVPVYYYTLMPDKDVKYINSSKIKKYGIEFVDYQQIDQQFRLYKLQLIPQEPKQESDQI